MADAVEARFYISGYERNSYDPTATRVKMQAVSRGEHNKSWAQATPAGTIEMTVKNTSAADWFVDRLGKEVAVTFTPAPGGDLPGLAYGPPDHANTLSLGAVGQEQDPPVLAHARVEFPFPGVLPRHPGTRRRHSRSLGAERQRLDIGMPVLDQDNPDVRH
jgi:hypothetical protein